MSIIGFLKTRYIKLFLFLVFLFILSASLGCSNSLPDNNVSDNPVNTAIIGISGNPGALFGNGCSESVIQVNTGIVEDGTPIEFEITFSSSLPPDLRGCLFDASPVVFDDMAFVNYLAGILIGIEKTATINISATINPPEGDTESDFITLTLQGVGINPPDNQDIMVPSDSEALDVFLTLAFTTVGIKPGTEVEVSLSNPGLGSFEGGADVVFPVVIGSEEAGEFFVQYNAFTGAGGTQVITARIFLEIPPELAAICPMPPEEDLIVEVSFSITQSVEMETPPPPPPL
jgi:hypothetical protein